MIVFFWLCAGLVAAACLRFAVVRAAPLASKTFTVGDAVFFTFLVLGGFLTLAVTCLFGVAGLIVWITSLPLWDRPLFSKRAP